MPDTCRDAPRRRLGPLSRVERRLLARAPMFTWGVVALLAVAAAAVKGCAS